nr:MAG TPA: hypothetical protein [Caudoviricetes sp.]
MKKCIDKLAKRLYNIDKLRDSNRQNGGQRQLAGVILLTVFGDRAATY